MIFYLDFVVNITYHVQMLSLNLVSPIYEVYYQRSPQTIKTHPPFIRHFREGILTKVHLKGEDIDSRDVQICIFPGLCLIAHLGSFKAFPNPPQFVRGSQPPTYKRGPLFRKFDYFPLLTYLPEISQIISVPPNIGKQRSIDSWNYFTTLDENHQF